jgi:hypothetical protein
VTNVAGVCAAQHRAIQRWESSERRLRAQYSTAKDLALQLGVSRSTLFDCIARKGRYVALSPESVAGARTAFSTTQRRTESGSSERSALLRAWRILPVDQSKAVMAPRSRTRSPSGRRSRT